MYTLCVTRDLLYCRNSVITKITILPRCDNYMVPRVRGLVEDKQLPRQDDIKGDWEIDQDVNGIRFHVKEIQLDPGRNGSQTAEFFKYRAVEALIC